MQQTFTFSLNSEQEKAFLKYLEGMGNESTVANSYVKWCLKGREWTALMYTSGKLVLQSSETLVESELNKILCKGEDFVEHIGSDEVGKGDYFGPLVVCACYVDEKILAKIVGYKIVDSKKLADKKIMELGPILTEIVHHEVKIISPKEYGELYEVDKNVAIILAKAHVETIVGVYGKSGGSAKYVVVDQFSKSKKRLSDLYSLDVPLRQYHHGESDIAVAVASVIARYIFLLEMEKMSEKYAMKFPLGATHVVNFGRDFVKRYGVKELENVAKISFRTTQQVTSLF